ncbi:SPOR domain-containing protein [Brevundimonas sp. BAL450]|jgi:D-alanyl-D-alanine carboxypeptidase|nr:SPOR domain-containing protein [Brevundimonas sp. BAL450]
MTAFTRQAGRRHVGLVQALLFAFVLVAAGLTPTPGAEPLVAQSGENTRYAAIVVDAESGEVLFARRADNPRYPASITKVMTLYMTFEALAEGRIAMDDMITVSPRAASQPPSKLGLAAGQRISVDDAIRSLAVRSANDIAVAIAEHVGGSEARFAAMSTLRAQELGMTQTRFVNPHGLPDSRQISSARDLAILSRAVMRDYPQYYHYFGQHHWVYNGRQYGNTNGLLHSGNGYDGIKTGFTNASGYNLAASAVRDGRRIITVVLGGRSSRTRNDHVAELMNTGFEVERRRAAGESIQVAQAFFESRGYGVGSAASGPVQYASVETFGSDSQPETSTAVAFTSAPADTSRVTSSSPSFTAALNGAPSQQAALRPAREAEPARAAGTWAVQVGAFRDRNVADNWLTEVNRRFRTQFTGAERAVQTAGEWYRSRFTGLTEDSARAACAALAERRVTCMVVRPD